MVIISDKNGTTDSVYHTLIKYIKSDVPIVMVSWVENFVFNEELLSIKNPIIIDFCEYGWDFKLTESHIWGRNSEKFPRYYNNDWVKFDNWVKENPPKLLLKRELLKKDISDNVKPIEYPCVVNEWPLQTKEQFDSRPVSAFQFWGRSNECRLRIHGEIWLHSFKKGFQVCDNLYYINPYMCNEKGEKWISLWIPHYVRVPIEDLLSVNNISKLSLSWEGAGAKCFRTTGESGVNSILVMHKNLLAWAYNWDETNCILVEDGKEIEGIEAALINPRLYEVYVKCVENTNRYRVDNYISEYLMPIINNA